MPEWLASLPLAGVDGTARRSRGAPGRAHLKTGSLNGVAGIAGIVHGGNGRRWAVVAVLQHPNAEAARPVLDAVLQAVLQADGQSPPPLPATPAGSGDPPPVRPPT
jgi:D-alanyl-D-alanine carboxypeptidase/D-alanyl-D-alanine-endopeptidase (penicillin-binding protein 4)